MPFYSLTRTKIVELNNQYKKKKEEYDQLNKKTPSKIWLEDLDTLLKVL